MSPQQIESKSAEGNKNFPLSNPQLTDNQNEQFTQRIGIPDNSISDSIDIKTDDSQMNLKQGENLANDEIVSKNKAQSDKLANDETVSTDKVDFENKSFSEDEIRELFTELPFTNNDYVDNDVPQITLFRPDEFVSMNDLSDSTQSNVTNSADTQTDQAFTPTSQDPLPPIGELYKTFFRQFLQVIVMTLALLVFPALQFITYSKDYIAKLGYYVVSKKDISKGTINFIMRNIGAIFLSIQGQFSKLRMYFYSDAHQSQGVFQVYSTKSAAFYTRLVEYIFQKFPFVQFYKKHHDLADNACQNVLQGPDKFCQVPHIEVLNERRQKCNDDAEVYSRSSSIFEEHVQHFSSNGQTENKEVIGNVDTVPFSSDTANLSSRFNAHVSLVTNTLNLPESIFSKELSDNKTPIIIDHCTVHLLETTDLPPRKTVLTVGLKHPFDPGGTFSCFMYM